MRPPFESLDQVTNTHNEESVLELFAGQQGDSQGQQGHPWDKRERAPRTPIKRECGPQTALAGLEPAFGLEVAGTAAMPPPPPIPWPAPASHYLEEAR
jgi:hypothetical protein